MARLARRGPVVGSGVWMNGGPVPHQYCLEDGHREIRENEKENRIVFNVIIVMSRLKKGKRLNIHS